MRERPSPWARQAFVRLSRGGVAVRLRIAPDGAGGARSFSQLGGHAVLPIDSLRATERAALLRQWVDAGRRRCGPDAARVVPLEPLVGALGAAADELGGVLVVERWALAGAPLAPPSWSMEGVAASLRPEDVEWTALAAGLRRVVKMEAAPPEVAARLLAEASRRGLRAALVEADHVAPTVLVADEADALERAEQLERALLSERHSDALVPAMREMGALLGYPACCVERFVDLGTRDDTGLAWALLPALPHAPQPLVTTWLSARLALLSHAPCSTACAPSCDVGLALLSAVEASTPGFRARFEAAAARLHVADSHGRRFALAVDGDADTGFLVRDVLVLDAPATGRPASAEAATGTRLRVEAGGVVAEDGRWCAPLAVDHRGAPGRC